MHSKHDRLKCRNVLIETYCNNSWQSYRTLTMEFPVISKELYISMINTFANMMRIVDIFNKNCQSLLDRRQMLQPTICIKATSLKLYGFFMLGTISSTFVVNGPHSKRTGFLYPQPSTLAQSFRLPPQLRAEVSNFFRNYNSTIQHHPVLLKPQKRSSIV